MLTIRPRLSTQAREQRAGDRDGAEDVDLELAPPLICRQQLDGSGNGDAGVVDERCDAAAVGQVERERLDVVVGGDIEVDRLDVGRLQRSEPSGIGIAAHTRDHVVAPPRKQSCRPQGRYRSSSR